MSVNPQDFAVGMARYWKTHIGGVVTPALTKVWQQQAEIYNQKIEGASKGKWVVLNPPTGTGKSRGLALYCSLLPEDNPPGVLIVVRQIDDANEIVAEINALAGQNIAITSHSENDTKTTDLQNYSVAIITHSAYLKAMDRPHQFDDFMKWQGGTRKLTVIDESLNIIDQIHIDFDQLQQLRGIIPRALQESHQPECSAIDQILSIMDSVIVANQGRSQTIYPEDWGLPEDFDFSRLRCAMKHIEFDREILEKADVTERKNLAEKYSAMFDVLQQIIQSSCWYFKKGNLHLFTYSRVLMPHDRMDAVIMDATASCNPIYELLVKKIILIDPPKGVRNYSNVNLFVSAGHKVGKISMSENPQFEVARFMQGVANVLPKDQKLLICTHKNIEPHFQGYSDMSEYALAHWGSVDGKNDWSDYGTAIMYGLPYLDMIVPEMTLRAIEAWLRIEFPKETRSNIVHRLSVGHQVVSLVQAINRVRCRRVTDESGGCEKTDIFLLLPHNLRAKEILDGVITQMPGMVLHKWNASSNRRKVRRSEWESVLISWLKNMQRGRYLVQAIRKELAIPASCFERLLKKATDEGSDLYRELEEVGVSLHRHGAGKGGRGHQSWFEKLA